MDHEELRLDPASSNTKVWDLRYRDQDTPWDKGYASPPLVDYLNHHTLAGRILVPGCGTGHDVRAIAAYSNYVLGVDISPQAIALAKAYRPTGNEKYVVDDLFDMPSRYAARFEWIWEHTCFCAILPEQRERYVQSMYAMLTDPGRLLGVFYISPDPEGNGPPFSIQTEELLRLFEGSFHLDQSYKPNVSYPGREGVELMLVMRKRA